MALTKFDASSLHNQPFPSRRSAVMGRRGMVATSQPLAAQVGLHVLQQGGNAFDAAVATAAALAVVEPTGCGLGGDCFALLYHARSGKVSALDASGRSPRGLSAEDVEAAAGSTMPSRGALTITVPGAVDGFARLLDEFGTCDLGAMLTPAIDLAEKGFPVSELVAAAWRRSEALLSEDADASRHWLLEGRAPRAGELFRIPAYARTMRLIAEDGAAAFYDGPIAEAIARKVAANGGPLALDDLRTHHGAWVTAVAVSFCGMRVWQCPPPGQGLATLIALATVRHLDPPPWAVRFGDVTHLHKLIEVMRLAFADAFAHIADPEFAPVPIDELLDDGYIAGRAALVNADRAMPTPTTGIPRHGDTVYLTVVDEEGNACSLIFSNYMGFGSGLVAGDTAIPLQNRGAGFTLEQGHPNRFAPGKRPFHTIIPGMATREKDGSLFGSFGVMGGHMQPQGQLQLACNLLGFGMDPQRALDAPRFQITSTGALALEPWFDDDIRTLLATMGHDVLPRASTPGASSFGGGQIIAIDDAGVRVGGSDPRKDGIVVAY